MSTGLIDFAAVQWARRLSANLEPLLALPAEDLHKVSGLLEKLAQLKGAEATPTQAQLTVILQYLHTKNLETLDADKGGLLAQFSGGGFEYERFLLREDGRIPNYRYESKRA